MIALGSVSYPYLAVAKKHEIKYSVVLAYVEGILEKRDLISPPYIDWRYDAWLAYNDEMKRRRKVLGV